VVNDVSTAFLYDNVTPVQEQSNGTVTANLLTGLGIDEYFIRSDAAGTRTLLADAIGSTVALLDQGGAVKTAYTYEPFGTTTAAGEANANAFQYTGRENDRTGLFYYRARYYKPQFQRFISEDPIGLAGGDTNLYRYVLNDPMNLVDPYGKFGMKQTVKGIEELGEAFEDLNNLNKNPKTKAEMLENQEKVLDAWRKAQNATCNLTRTPGTPTGGPVSRFNILKPKSSCPGPSPSPSPSPVCPP
jgi:RHS repeat-associated protein